MLHVVDASDERFRENIQAVETVLQEIDAHEVPTLLVMNKIDNLEEQSPRIERDDEGVPRVVWISAMQGAGTELLFEALSERWLAKWWSITYVFRRDIKDVSVAHFSK